MKLKIIDSKSAAKGEIELPSQFNEAIRQDLIQRAVLSIQSNKRQPYGTMPEAGKQYSIDISKRRHDYKTVYGFGASRTPRKIMSRSGTRMNWVGAFAPQTRGGRRAHPPKAEKILSQKINVKERRKAIRSAIAATIIRELVQKRGHRLPDSYPFIVDMDADSMAKAKDVEAFLAAIGFDNDLQRAAVKSVRAGRGKMRGRKYARKKSVLIVTASNSKLTRAASNIPGVDVVEVRNLNADLLAPGAMPGRATIWSKAAIEAMKKDGLFN